MFLKILVRNFQRISSLPVAEREREKALNEIDKLSLRKKGAMCLHFHVNKQPGNSCFFPKDERAFQDLL